MEAREPVIQLDPLVPFHAPQPHGDVVRPVPEGPVGDRLRSLDVPAGIGRRGGPLEVHGDPYARSARGGFERGGGCFAPRGWFFEVRCWGPLGMGGGGGGGVAG